jgi:plasmid stabilization system protein ParE
LLRLREFIRIKNPNAANRVAQRIRSFVNQLPDQPLIGKNVTDIDEPRLRDFYIPFGQAGYWIRYLVRDDDIVIIRIWHGRENRDIVS